MTTLTQTLTLTYPQDAQLDLNTKVYSLCTGLTGVCGKCPLELSWRNIQGREVLRDLGHVRGKWPDTVPEWQKINLVTLQMRPPGTDPLLRVDVINGWSISLG